MSKFHLRKYLTAVGLLVTVGTTLFPYFSSANSINNDSTLYFKPSWESKGTPFRHTWEGMGNVDQFRWMVRKDMQDQLSMARKDLNMKNVRAVGLFDEEMRIFGLDPKTWKDSNRTPRYNWQVIDYVIQSMLDKGINPMITTAFTPYAMASGEQYCFTTKGNVTPPKDYEKWADLVDKTTKHFIERFGLETVKSWYFEVWNEPNLDAFWKGADKAEYFKLWAVTYKAIKGVNKNIRIGGPSTARADWIKDFIDYGRGHKCEADYIITHVYNNDSPFAALSPFAGPQADKINGSPNFLPGIIKGTRKLLDSLGYKGELHFNEWGRSWFPSDEIRESQYEAAFLVKCMAEASQYADYFGYWCLSDIYDQAGYGAETFHGNYGMLSLDGLKKPSYKAFELLGKLGNRQIQIQSSNNDVLKSAIATKNESGYQFLFYALEKDFIVVKNDVNKIKVSFSLPKKFNPNKIKITQIGNSENNILYEWRKMNNPSYLNKFQLQELKKHNILKSSKLGYKIISSKEGKKIEFDTEITGVALVEIGI